MTSAGAVPVPPDSASGAAAGPVDDVVVSIDDVVEVVVGPTVEPVGPPTGDDPSSGRAPAPNDRGTPAASTARVPPQRLA